MNTMNATEYNRENGVCVTLKNRTTWLARLEGYQFFEGYAQDETLTPISGERVLLVLEACMDGGFVDIDHDATTATIWLF